MEQRQNTGYVITDSIHVGTTEFVIGYHPKAPSPYVTWQCASGNNYFWGHYCNDRLSAVKSLLERAGQELEIITSELEKRRKSKGYER